MWGGFHYFFGVFCLYFNMALARHDPHWMNGVPKSGTAVPNRIFVGGIAGNMKEEDLANLFSKYGTVKSTKIILDRGGISKGYGFVTFETEEEAQDVLNVECVTFKDRKLNIAPAVKKQPYNHNRTSMESNSVSSTSIVWPNQQYSSASGFARDNVYYPQASWPVLWPPPLYLQQQCNYPQTGQSGYVYSIAPAEYSFPPMPPISEYSESSSDTEVGKNRPKSSTSHQNDSERVRQAPKQRSSSPQRCVSSNAEVTSNYMQPPIPPHLHHPMFAKSVNGVTVMAYPGSFMMGSPALVHVRDGSSESENVLTELSFLHSPMVSGTLTPPPTPLAPLPCELNAIESFRKN